MNDYSKNTSLREEVMLKMFVIGLDSIKPLKLIKDIYVRMDRCCEININENDYYLLQEVLNTYNSTEGDYHELLAIVNNARIYKDYVVSINSITDISIWVFSDFYVNQGRNYCNSIMDRLTVLSNLRKKVGSNIKDINFIVSGIECYKEQKAHNEAIDYSLINNELERINKNTLNYLNKIDELFSNNFLQTNIFMISGSFKLSSEQSINSMYAFLRIIMQFEYWLKSRVNDFFQNEDMHVYCKENKINYADASDIADEIYSYYSYEAKGLNKYYLGDNYYCSIGRLLGMAKRIIKLDINTGKSKRFITDVDTILDKQLLYAMPYLLDAHAVKVNENVDDEVIEKLGKKLKESIATINKQINQVDMVSFTKKTINLESGDTITYYTAGKGQPIYIINAYGVDVSAWKPFVSMLAERYYFVIGEVRGVKQQKAIDNSTRKFGVYDHIGDIEEIIKNEKLNKFHLISWCSGVKQAFIFTQNNIDKVLSNIVLTGEYAPYENSQKEHSKFSENVKDIYKIINEDKRVLEYYMKIIINGLFTTSTDYEKLMNKVKLSEIGNVIDFIFQIVPENDKNLILDAYSSSEKMISFLEMCVEYYTHDIEEIIKKIKIPTIIISSEKDIVANYKQATWADGSLKYSNHIILPEATHWLIRERIDDLSNIIDAHNKNCRLNLAKKYYQEGEKYV